MRIRSALILNAHRLESWDKETWPDWLQECVGWIVSWRSRNWLHLDDVIYMKGPRIEDGLSAISPEDWADWEVTDASDTQSSGGY